MKKLTTLVAIVAMLTGVALASGNNPLPFGVKIGGQSAQRSKGHATVAVIAKPVAPDARLSVQHVKGEVIVNLFPAKPDGTTRPGAKAMILLFKANSSKKLSENMQKKKPASGYYLANVMAGGKTSRVVFRIKG